MQQHGWIFKTLHWVKEARHKRECILGFHLYKVQRRAKLIYGDKGSKKCCLGEGGLAGKEHQGNCLGLWKSSLPWPGVLITHLYWTKLTNCTLKIYVFFTLWKLYLHKGRKCKNKPKNPLDHRLPSSASSRARAPHRAGMAFSSLSCQPSAAFPSSPHPAHNSRPIFLNQQWRWGWGVEGSRLGAQRSQFKSQLHVFPAVSSGWATVLL